MKATFCNEHCNEYSVTCNEVKVLKNGLNFTWLKVKVFPFLNTSLKVKVLKLLLKYSNVLLLLRYCTTLMKMMPPDVNHVIGHKNQSQHYQQPLMFMSRFIRTEKHAGQIFIPHRH